MLARLSRSNTAALLLLLLLSAAGQESGGPAGESVEVELQTNAEVDPSAGEGSLASDSIPAVDPSGDSAEEAAGADSVFTSPTSSYRVADVFLPHPALSEDQWQSLFRAYFDVENKWSFPLEPVRLRNATKEEFEGFIRRGIPVIVSDLTRDWDMSKWNVQALAERFPKEHVTRFSRFNYSLAGDAYEPQPTRPDQHGQRLPTGPKQKSSVAFSDVDWFSDEAGKTDAGDSWFWYSIVEPEMVVPLSFEFDAAHASANGGFFLPRSSARTKEEHELRDKLIDGIAMPWFLPDSRENREIFSNRMEMFFGTLGSGVTPHIDEVCDPIMSVQLSGSKLWKLGLPSATYDATPDVFQSKLETLWDEPLFEFVLDEGEAIFFPPGMLHATYVVDPLPKLPKPPIALSMSLQYFHPRPLDFLRLFADVLLSTPATCCYAWTWTEAWVDWKLEPNQRVPGEEAASAPAEETAAEDGSEPSDAATAAADSTADGDSATAQAAEGAAAPDSEPKPSVTHSQLFSFQDEYIARFHASLDLDGDGIVTLDEAARLFGAEEFFGSDPDQCPWPEWLADYIDGYVPPESDASQGEDGQNVGSEEHDPAEAEAQRARIEALLSLDD